MSLGASMLGAGLLGEGLLGGDASATSGAQALAGSISCSSTVTGSPPRLSRKLTASSSGSSLVAVQKLTVIRYTVNFVIYASDPPYQHGDILLATVTGPPAVVQNIANGSSQVSGSMGVRRKVQASCSGSSTATGNIIKIKTVTGTCTGSSTVTSNLTRSVLRATCTGTATVTAQPYVQYALQKTISCAATVAGRLSKTDVLASSVTCSSSVTAAMRRLKLLYSDVSCSSTVTGSASRHVLHGTTIVCSSTITANYRYVGPQNFTVYCYPSSLVTCPNFSMPFHMTSSVTGTCIVTGLMYRLKRFAFTTINTSSSIPSSVIVKLKALEGHVGGKRSNYIYHDDFSTFSDGALPAPYVNTPFGYAPAKVVNGYVTSDVLDAVPSNYVNPTYSAYRQDVTNFYSGEAANPATIQVFKDAGAWVPATTNFADVSVTFTVPAGSAGPPATSNRDVFYNSLNQRLSNGDLGTSIPDPEWDLTGSQNIGKLLKGDSTGSHTYSRIRIFNNTKKRESPTQKEFNYNKDTNPDFQKVVSYRSEYWFSLYADIIVGTNGFIGAVIEQPFHASFQLGGISTFNDSHTTVRKLYSQVAPGTSHVATLGVSPEGRVTLRVDGELWAEAELFNYYLVEDIYGTRTGTNAAGFDTVKLTSDTYVPAYQFPRTYKEIDITRHGFSVRSNGAAKAKVTSFGVSDSRINDSSLCGSIVTGQLRLGSNSLVANGLATSRVITNFGENSAIPTENLTYERVVLQDKPQAYWRMSPDLNFVFKDQTSSPVDLYPRGFSLTPQQYVDGNYDPILKPPNAAYADINHVPTNVFGKALIANNDDKAVYWREGYTSLDSPVTADSFLWSTPTDDPYNPGHIPPYLYWPNALPLTPSNKLTTAPAAWSFETWCIPNQLKGRTARYFNSGEDIALSGEFSFSGNMFWGCGPFVYWRDVEISKNTADNIVQYETEAAGPEFRDDSDPDFILYRATTTNTSRTVRKNKKVLVTMLPLVRSSNMSDEDERQIALSDRYTKDLSGPTEVTVLSQAATAGYVQAYHWGAVYDMPDSYNEFKPVHVVVTFDGNARRIYLDGQLVDTYYDAKPSTAVSMIYNYAQPGQVSEWAGHFPHENQITIGGNAFGSFVEQYPPAKAMDETAIYHYALTPAQIQVHYRVGYEGLGTKALHARSEGSSAVKPNLPGGLYDRYFLHPGTITCSSTVFYQPIRPVAGTIQTKSTVTGSLLYVNEAIKATSTGVATVTGISRSTQATLMVRSDGLSTVIGNPRISPRDLDTPRSISCGATVTGTTTNQKVLFAPPIVCSTTVTDRSMLGRIVCSSTMFIGELHSGFEGTSFGQTFFGYPFPKLRFHYEALKSESSVCSSTVTCQPFSTVPKYRFDAISCSSTVTASRTIAVKNFTQRISTTTTLHSRLVDRIGRITITPDGFVTLKNRIKGDIGDADVMYTSSTTTGNLTRDIHRLLSVPGEVVVERALTTSLQGQVAKSTTVRVPAPTITDIENITYYLTDRQAKTMFI